MDGIEYSVGPAGFSDWSGLHRLLTDCFSYMDGRIDPPSSLTRMTPDGLQQKAQDEVLVVVVHEDRLVAAGFLRDSADTIYLSKLAVEPAFRKKGILRSMIRIAEALAQERGKTHLELETRIELIENHRTFGALGFIKTGETSHDGYSRPTSVTMRKPI